MTIKADEVELMANVLDNEGRLSRRMHALLTLDGVFPRAGYVINKWVKKGWWEYRVSLFTGWLTEKGKAKIPGVYAKAREHLTTLPGIGFGQVRHD